MRQVLNEVDVTEQIFFFPPFSLKTDTTWRGNERERDRERDREREGERERDRHAVGIGRCYELLFLLLTLAVI